MKMHLLVLPVILATTAATADPLPSPLHVLADAQVQAAALLNAAHTSQSLGANKERRSQSHMSPAMDAQASAAELLSPSRRSAGVNVDVPIASATRLTADAQKQAAALLSSS